MRHLGLRVKGSLDIDDAISAEKQTERHLVGLRAPADVVHEQQTILQGTLLGGLARWGRADRNSSAKAWGRSHRQ